MACKNRVFVSTRVEAAKLLPSSVAPATELLDTTSAWPELMLSLSSPKGGEGWGEEATLIECPSPRSCLAGRGRKFLVVVSKCTRFSGRDDCAGVWSNLPANEMRQRIVLRELFISILDDFMQR